jgi:predicted TIM-barrel fold metal-dependent hydrolase
LDRYLVISADCHAGARIRDYRPFLEARYHDDFDAWAAAFRNPYRDLEGKEADRNWDSAKRARELEDEGIVAEVVYPNTIPPFFPVSGLFTVTPPASELERRLAGLRAHNRWLAAFCAELPGRRAGVGHMLLNDVDEAVRDVHWIADHGLTGGVLLPGTPPGSAIAPLHAPVYDPVWRACEERGVVVNAHGGNGSPDYGPHPASTMLWLMETNWFSHRPLWTLVLAGVFDRFPDLRLVVAEQGAGWIPAALEAMDRVHADAERGGVGELRFGGDHRLSRRPSECWSTNVAVAASFLHRDECARRHDIGVDRIMWGSDYPHLEGTSPFSKEAIRMTFAGVDPAEVRPMLGENAARVYGFDVDALRPLADRYGPTTDEVRAGLDHVPPGATSLAFRPHAVTVG